MTATIDLDKLQLQSKVAEVYSNYLTVNNLLFFLSFTYVHMYLIIYILFLCDLLTYFLTSLLLLKKFFKTDLANHIIDIFIVIEIRDTDLQKSLDFRLNPICISLSCFPGLKLCTYPYLVFLVWNSVHVSSYK